MFAVVYQVDVKSGWQGDVDAELDKVVEMTKGTAGFIRGTWASDGTKAMSFIVMQDEASAREMAANSAMPPEASVTLRSLDVYEIARDV